jgi:hypothetical protein
MMHLHERRCIWHGAKALTFTQNLIADFILTDQNMAHYKLPIPLYTNATKNERINAHKFTIIGNGNNGNIYIFNTSKICVCVK